MAFLRKHMLLIPYCMHVFTSFMQFVQIHELNINDVSVYASVFLLTP
jgi:hypothetical protein